MVLRRRQFLHLVLIALSLMLSTATTEARTVYLRLGTLWDSYSDEGHGGWNGAALVWPGGTRGYSSTSYKGFLYGAKDFVVPDTARLGFKLPNNALSKGDTLKYYVVAKDIPNQQGAEWNRLQLLTHPDRGPQDRTRGTIVYLRTAPTQLGLDSVLNHRLRLRFSGSYIDSLGNYVETPAIIDPDLAADVKIVQWWRNNMGITTTRRIYQSLHPDHDDYIVWHYSFKNDGRFHQSDYKTRHSNTIHGFYYGWSMSFMAKDRGSRTIHADEYKSGDNNTGYDPERRMMYGFDGDASHVPGDDHGDPHPDTKEMLGARWPGIAMIHADRTVSSRTDDQDQPKRMDIEVFFDWPKISNGFETVYNTMIWPGGSLGGSTYRYAETAEAQGLVAPPVGSGVSLRPGFVGPVSTRRYFAGTNMFSVGGWDIPPGDSINVVWVAAVGGMPNSRAKSLGALENKGEITEVERVREFYSLQDTLNTVVDRARKLLKGASSVEELERRLATISKPPGGPDSLSVSGKIPTIVWTPPKGGEVRGYNIYRFRDRESSLIAEMPKSSRSYTDSTAPKDVWLRYIVTSVGADGLESSQHTSRTLRRVFVIPPGVPDIPFDAPGGNILTGLYGNRGPLWRPRSHTGRWIYLFYNQRRPGTEHSEYLRRTERPPDFSIPVHSAELKGHTVADSVVLSEIAAGKLDPYLRSWAEYYRDSNHPVFWRFGYEMNGDWFPWGGRDPELFKLAWRHAYEIFKEVGATNVIWVWCPNVKSIPEVKDAPWNDMHNYYPGDDYVDWVAVDGYNWGESRDSNNFKWLSFDELFGPVLAEFSEKYPTKPQMIGEMASVDGDGGSMAQWITEAYASIPHYPNLHAVMWFNYDTRHKGEADWLITEAQGALEAYNRAIHNPVYVSGFDAAVRLIRRVTERELPEFETSVYLMK